MSRRELLLVRHAKAESGSSAERDFARKLTAEGRAAAKELGDFLTGQQISGCRVVASSAPRAWETAVLMAEALGLPEESILPERRIYEASRSELVAVMHELPEAWERVILVGHNPGLSHLATWLVGESSELELPTAGLAWITGLPASWSAVTAGCGRLQASFPRQL